MRPRISPDVLIIGALLLVLSLASLRIASRARPAPERENPRRSVASPHPGGWKALYQLLAERGARVERMERAPGEWPAEVRVMVSGEPDRGVRGFRLPAPWTKDEVKDALRWLGPGRTLVLMSGRSHPLLEELGLQVGGTGQADATLFPLQPAPFLAGVSGVTIPGAGRFTKTPRESVPLLSDAEPAAVVLQRNGGTVVAVSDASLAANKHLTRADNARFLTGLLESMGGTDGRIAFDEYHQGYRAQVSLWDAIGSSGRLAAWQIVLIMALIAYSASRRFGLPRPLPQPSRVSSEYVASLADLYRRARAGDAALESVYSTFRRDVCRAIGVPVDTGTDEWVPRAARVLGAGGGASLEQRLQHLAQRCEAAMQERRLPERELVALVRDMETLRKELRLGGHEGGVPRRG